MTSRAAASHTRLTVIGAVTALVLTACAGFGGSDSDDETSEGKTKIVFSYLWTGEEAKAVEQIIADFNASQDEIVVEGVSNPDQQKQVLSMASSNGTFDVSDTGESQIQQWAARGILEPLDSYIEADDYDTSDFLPQASANTVIDGETYALPIAVHTYQLLYNQALYDEAGLLGPPTTFEEWADQIERLSEVSGDGTIERLGLATTDFLVLAQAYGGGWYDESGQPTPDDPANVAALEWWVDNVRDAYGAKQLQTFVSGFGEYASADAPFYTGQVAAVVEGEWQSQFIRTYAPDLKWGVAPLPYPEGRPDLAGTSRMDLSTMFIPRNSEHKEEAWEFVKYFLSPDAMREFTLALANLPSRSSLLDDPAYAELPNFQVWADALKNPNIEPLPVQPFSEQYGADLTAAFDDIIAGRAEPAEALADVAERAADY